ncbi:MAG TPA: hypothetical protein VJX66_09985 [Amycolatopsis sp.]|nr:hypothetical protein [Amycolatopsis sp.]
MATETITPLRAELDRLVVPAAAELIDHPYYRGLADGSLPGAALSALCRQDNHHLLPTYARALAQCAAVATRHDHGRLLAKMSLVSFESALSSAAGFPGLAREFGLPDADGGAPEIAETTAKYVAFLRMSTVSPAAGLGAVLPSAWLYQLVTDDLMARRDPDTRYGGLIAIMYPGTEFVTLIEEFLTLLEEFWADTAADHDVLLAHVEQAIAHEKAFVDAAWQAG